MNVQIDRTDRSDSESTSSAIPTHRERRRRIDVTDLDATSVQEFVRHSIETDEVSLEHRGARTYLLVGR